LTFSFWLSISTVNIFY